jgi:hypothetical protein
VHREEVGSRGGYWVYKQQSLRFHPEYARVPRHESLASVGFGRVGPWCGHPDEVSPHFEAIWLLKRGACSPRSISRLGEQALWCCCRWFQSIHTIVCCS